MKGSTRFVSFLPVVLVCALTPFVLRAQTSSETVQPSEGTPMITGEMESVPQEQPSRFKPDENPLTGAQQATIGIPKTPSYWTTGFQFANSFQNNTPFVTSSTEWVSTSYFLGALSLVQMWPRSRLAMNYSGGGFVSAASNLFHGYNHQLASVQQFDWRRWQLLLLDQFSYLPESSFGYGGGSNISLPGVGGSFGANMPGLQSTYMPSQNIFTGSGARYSNAAVTEVNYLVSPRTSLTATGSYQVLRFVQPGNINGNSLISSLGCNYRVSERNTLGLVYHFSALRYLGAPQALNDHVAQVAYGRKITGRLGLELFGGPEITLYRVPIARTTHRIDFTAQAQLTYQFARGNITGSYSHGLGSGSGVLIGSLADMVKIDISRQLSRAWQAMVGFGYAKNGAIDEGMEANPSQNFDTWYSSAGLSRTLGRTANFSVNYVGRFQHSSLLFCINSSCQTNYTQHQVWAGFSWSTRPFVTH